jgi:hypothetical protein
MAMLAAPIDAGLLPHAAKHSSWKLMRRGDYTVEIRLQVTHRARNEGASHGST